MQTPQWGEGKQLLVGTNPSHILVASLCRWMDPMVLQTRKSSKQSEPSLGEEVYGKVNSSAFWMKWWNVPLYQLDGFNRAADILIAFKHAVEFLLKVLFHWLMFFLWGAPLKAWSKSFTFSSETCNVNLVSLYCFVAWIKGIHLLLTLWRDSALRLSLTESHQRKEVLERESKNLT